MLLIISQNITNFNIPLPNDVIFRINLAWINSIDELKFFLKKLEGSKVFLDLPIGRTKPPDNKYSFQEILEILHSHKNIKYFAISNVNSASDLSHFLNSLPDHITLVPKIESPEGIENIKEIVNSLGSEKILMLDHDDLFSNTIKQNQDSSKFKVYLSTLVNFCNTNNITLLRTVGVIFSDEEKRITEYVK